MPNTLAHIGSHGLLSSTIFKKSDLKWVFIGCILPDVPWIIRRIVLSLKLPISDYDIQLYITVQSSLVFCLLISTAIATFSTNYKRTIIILFVNSFLHLIIDSFQIKWANGVHLFAPYSWRLVRFDYFWPDTSLVLIFTIIGFIFMIFVCFKSPVYVYDLRLPKKKFLLILLISSSLYLGMPLFLLEQPEAANNHFTKTLKEVELRQDRYLEFDRRPIYEKNKNCTIRSFANEEIVVRGVRNECKGNVSVRGVFIDRKTIEVIEIHRHWGIIRDVFSYLGLLLIGYYWLRCLKVKFKGNS